MFGCAAWVQSHSQTRDSAQNPPASQTTVELPPLPHGKRTVMGGAIRDVDPVRDRFKLVPVGGHPITILYDARTHFYRNGVRISVLDLRSAEHASVETTLDGTKIFAVSVHALTTVPGGVTQGQVISYNPRSGELKLNTSLTHQPVTLLVPQGTPEELVGQEAGSAKPRSAVALSAGALIEVQFKPGNKGRGVATHISVLAVPGQRFAFAGQLVTLNMSKGAMVIENAADHHDYQITFYPAQFQASSQLREGRHVRVTAVFNGTGYVADEITVE